MRRKPILRVDPLWVACVTCGAPEGHACRTLTRPREYSRMTRTHLARYRDAERYSPAGRGE